MSKVARFAASKAAAFGYAVIVGVAGNVAFNFVERHQPPVIAGMPAASRPAGRSTPSDRAAAIAPIPVIQPAAPRPLTPASPRAAPPPLPEPPAVALPAPDALPAPALTPAALPAAPQAAERPMPPPAPRAEAAPLPTPAALLPTPAARPKLKPTAALPPLGPAVEVTSLPLPPASSAAAKALLAAPAAHAAPAVAPVQPLPAFPDAARANAAPPARNDNGWQLSDIWHPTRAVRKGLDWAHQQVPHLGDDAAALPFPNTSPPAAPIALLPPAALHPVRAQRADVQTAPAKPTAPGPGSGGLY